MSELLPMCAAPRDGTPILVWRKKKRTGPVLRKVVVIAHWGEGEGYRHARDHRCWVLEVTSNDYYAQDEDLYGWLPIPAVFIEPPKPMKQEALL